MRCRRNVNAGSRVHNTVLSCTEIDIYESEKRFHNLEMHDQQLLAELQEHQNKYLIEGYNHWQGCGAGVAELETLYQVRSF